MGERDGLSGNNTGSQNMATAKGRESWTALGCFMTGETKFSHLKLRSDCVVLTLVICGNSGEICHSLAMTREAAGHTGVFGVFTLRLKCHSSLSEVNKESRYDKRNATVLRVLSKNRAGKPAGGSRVGEDDL